MVIVLLKTVYAEGRGDQSSLSFKGMCTETACWKQNWFSPGQISVFLQN